MAQRYSPGIAHERMADETCPECGNPADYHYRAATVAAMFAPCNLLRTGVIERIEQYRADLDEAGA